MTTAIQKSSGGALETLYSGRWTPSVVDVLRKQVCPKGITDDEFFVFLMRCQQSGLNPLLGHAYCVPRRAKVSAKGEPDKWVTNHVFQPAIDGMRARAAEFPDFRMSDSAAIYEKDLITIDKGSGEIVHKTNPAGQRGRLVGAWGRVRLKDGSANVVELPVGSRGGDSAFWNADPGSMLAKCAEAAALRKTYPVAFAGIHIREEMLSEEREPGRTEVVLSAAPPPAPAAPALPNGPVVEFGEWKGREIASLSGEEKQAAVAYAEWQMEQHPKMGAKVKAALTSNLGAIRSSMGAAQVVDDAEVVVTEPTSPLPLSHPDAQPPEPGAEG